MILPITESVNLKPLATEDAPVLFSLINENRAYLKEWLPWLDDNTREEHSRSFIASTIESRAHGSSLVFGVFHNETLVGVCGFNTIDRRYNFAEIGYWLAENMNGKGIITRCVEKLIAYAFVQLNLEKVYVSVATDNIRSRAVCERLELPVDQIMPGAGNLYGKAVDQIRYVARKKQRHGL